MTTSSLPQASAEQGEHEASAGQRERSARAQQPGFGCGALR
jgi:hypothetical protein